MKTKLSRMRLPTAMMDSSPILIHPNLADSLLGLILHNLDVKCLTGLILQSSVVEVRILPMIQGQTEIRQAMAVVTPETDHQWAISPVASQEAQVNRLCSEFSVNAYPHGKTVHILRSSEPEAVTELPPLAARSVLDRLA